MEPTDPGHVAGPPPDPGYAFVIRHPDSVVLPVWIRPPAACPPMPLVAQASPAARLHEVGVDQQRQIWSSAFAQHDELRSPGSRGPAGTGACGASALHCGRVPTQYRDQAEASPLNSALDRDRGPCRSHRPKPTAPPPTPGQTWPLSPRSSATDGPCQRAPAHMSPCRGPPPPRAARGLAHDRLGSVSSSCRAALRKHAPPRST